MAVKALINAAIDSARKARMQRAKDGGHSAAIGAGVLGAAALTPQEAEAGVVNVFGKGRQLVGEFDDRFLGGVGGSNPRVNLKDRVANMETSVTPRDMSRPSNVNLYDYEGSPYILTQSDRSAAGGELTGINNTDISPVDLRGGRDYMFDPKSEGTVWASAPSVVNSLGGRASVAAARQGKDTILLPYSMAPTGIDFATMPLDTMVGFARANMSKANKKALDKGIKDIIPEWNGVADPDSVEVFRTVAGPKRKAIADLIDKKFRNVKGGMSISEARAATSDPSQMRTPDGEITNLGTINATDNIAQSTHPTYTGGLRGEGVGVLSDPLSVRPFMEQNGRVLAGDSSDIRALSMNHGLSQGIIDSNLLKSVYGNANPLLLGGIAATTAAGLALSGEAEAGVGKGIKSALRVFDTEDGYRFFELSDGTLVDNLDPDAVDMAFDNIKQLKDEMGDGVFQIGDELAKARYSKNNVDISELNRKYYKDMDSSPQKGNANPLLLGGVAATTAAGLALSGEAEAGPVNIIDPITGLIRKGIEAYHGSPHRFDKFSMDNIGTGEGAQAYGHGLYFADKKGVAESYRDTLATRAIDNVTGIDQNKVVDDVARMIGADEDEWGQIDTLLGNSIEFDQPIGQIAEGLGADYLQIARRITDNADAHKEMQTYANYLKSSEGSLYRTELDVDPDTLLDWDKPLSGDKAEALRLALNDAANDAANGPTSLVGFYTDSAGNSKRFTPDDVEKMDGASAYEMLQQVYGNDASKKLNEYGIPGIRYLDGDSRSAGKGSSNYVMFDDSKISIKERGMATPAALAVTAGVTGTGLALSDSPDYLDTLASQVNRGPEGSLYDAPQEFAAQQPYETPTEVAPQRSMMDQITSSPYAAALGDAASVAGQGASFAFDALELPMRYGHGLAAALGVLAEGGTWDNALLRGSKVGKQSLDVTGKQLGEYVARKTGNPYAAALTDAVTNVTSPL